MNCTSTTTRKVVATKLDVIAALKMRFPGLMDVEALPFNGVGVSLKTDSSGSVTLTRTVEAGRHD